MFRPPGLCTSNNRLPAEAGWTMMVSEQVSIRRIGGAPRWLGPQAQGKCADRAKQKCIEENANQYVVITTLLLQYSIYEVVCQFCIPSLPVVIHIEEERLSPTNHLKMANLLKNLFIATFHLQYTNKIPFIREPEQALFTLSGTYQINRLLTEGVKYAIL
jgi:hypothetical protein